MGTTFYAVDIKFFIPKEELPFVLNRFREHSYHPLPDLPLPPPPYAKLVEYLCLWGFTALYDEDGNMTSLVPDHSTYRTGEDCGLPHPELDDYYRVFYSLLAPSVRDGCFLTFITNDELWGWRFQKNSNGTVEARLETSVYCVFESDLTPEQVKYYVEDVE